MTTKKQWLIAMILTFITACAWVVFDVLHTRSQVEVSPQLKEVIEPINPQLDLKALENTP